VDRSDRVLGYESRAACHAGHGRLHRAVAVLLHDSRGRVLLQRRRATLWDGYWDISAATHPLHVDGRDESYEEAAHRSLEVEWGIRTDVLPVHRFIYQELFGDSAEHEYCVLLAGRWEEDLHPNRQHVSDVAWVAFGELCRDVRTSAGSYTPWARIAIHGLESHPLLELMGVGLPGVGTAAPRAGRRVRA
jgi:isopentenyl-diphosphate delta-isomerase